jgi:glycolate oxidase FAD binding subunit
MDETESLAKLNEWGGRPLPLSASAWKEGVLCVRLEGAAAAVDTACASLGGNRMDDGAAGAFWQGVRDQTDPFFARPHPLWRLSVPSTTKAALLAGVEFGQQLIEWGGALRWIKTNGDPEWVRGAATAAGGHATLFRGGDRTAGVFQPLGSVVARLHRNVKDVFDPAGVFNRGRLYPES